MIWDFEQYLAEPEGDERELLPRRPAPGKVTLTASLAPGGSHSFEKASPRADAYLATPIQRKEASDHHDDPFGWDSWGRQTDHRVQSIAAHGVSTSADRMPHFDQIQRSFGHHDISEIQAHVGGSAA